MDKMMASGNAAVVEKLHVWESPESLLDRRSLSPQPLV